MPDLAGKVVLLTGGANGLGRVFGRALGAAGATVVLTDIADGTEAAAECGGSFLEADVSDPAAMRRVADAVRAAHGRIDVLINNAALYATLPPARYDAIEPALFDRVMAVNARGVLNAVQAVAPDMEARGRGRIVNVTSGTVLKGLPNMLHYIASKGAVTAMTRALSRELGPSGVTVNSLAPGLTLSDSILANEAHLADARAKVVASRAIPRDGHPEDLVGAVLFLCSDASAFVTGQTILVDGGSGNT